MGLVERRLNLRRHDEHCEKVTGLGCEMNDGVGDGS
jgi:hypothetical protein